MDVYFVNCFLACTLSFLIGKWYAERQCKHLLARMMARSMGAAIIAPKNISDDK